MRSETTSEELKDCLSRLGLSQTQAAYALGIGLRTMKRYCSRNNGRAIPHPIVKLLAAMESEIGKTDG